MKEWINERIMRENDEWETEIKKTKKQWDDDGSVKEETENNIE